MRSRVWSRALMGVLLLLGAGTALLALLLVALDRGALRRPLMHALSWYLERPLAVRGALRLHLLSGHPSLEAEQVTLGNPPWTAPGEMGSATHLSLQFRWGVGIDGLQLEGAQLNLARDTDGFANWQFRRPEPGQLPTLPPLRALKGSGVHLHLADAQRRIEFDGPVSGGSLDGAPLRLTAQGTLNTRPAQLTLSGDPLQGVAAGRPYPFEFTARGSGARLQLKGRLPKPFELDLFDADFEASGVDLNDLRFLVGLSLVDTGPFRFTGGIERRGTLTRFHGLALSSGESDLGGELAVETREKRPRLEGELHSRRLRSSDVGLRAAGRAPDATPAVFPDAKLSLAGTRHVDAQIRLGADRLSLGRFLFSGVTTRLQLEAGELELSPFDGQLLGGRFTAQLHLDARRDVPPVQLQLQLQGADLQELPLHMDSRPLAGPLTLSAHLTGRGRSVHEVAATAGGSAEFRVQQGSIRASIAELAGLDLRGIGLTLTGSQRDTGLRCAVGSFQASDGTLTASRLIIDTDPVLIRGEGTIQLGAESLDLRLRGEPKQTRLLRFASPLLIKGSLSKPSVSADPHAESFRLVDRGRAQDADCAAL